MVDNKKILNANQEILGGIRSAILRGETLRDAMMTFYSAGYKKEEIEDAARAYVALRNSGEAPAEKPQKKFEEEKKEGEIVKGKTEEKKGFAPVKNVFGVASEAKKPKVVQRESNYKIPDTKKSSPSGKIATIILITILVLLLGVLAAVFLFKEELVNFFNSMFG